MNVSHLRSIVLKGALVSRFKWQIQVILALTVSLFFILSSTLVAFAATLVQLSSDPYRNTTSQHQTEVEPDTYSFGSTIVSAFQAGRFATGGGSSNIGWATSTDSGTTWSSDFLPATTIFSNRGGGPYERASDPSVAYDARDGYWLISWLGLFPNGNTSEVDVLVSRSTDGIHWWPSPVVVNADGHFNDKDWIVCDDTASSPFYGNCYTEFEDNTLSGLIQMSTSTDGGQSWQTPQATADNAQGLGGRPLVQPNGTVIVPYAGIRAFTSTNGGTSWSSSVLVSTGGYHQPNGGLRASPRLPSAAIDASGKVYVVWADCRFESGCSANDLVMSTSTDGVNWSAVTRIPIDPVGSGVDHFIPGLAVDRATSGSQAHLALAYYYYPATNCSTSTCQLDVGFISSTNGGNNWSAQTQLAGPMTLTWLASTTLGYMVGDYISTSFSGECSPCKTAGGKAYPVFAVATAPSGSTLNEAMFTVPGGLTIL